MKDCRPAEMGAGGRDGRIWRRERRLRPAEAREVAPGGLTRAAREKGGWEGGTENLRLRQSPNNPYPVMGQTLNEEGGPGTDKSLILRPRGPTPAGIAPATRQTTQGTEVTASSKPPFPVAGPAPPYP